MMKAGVKDKFHPDDMDQMWARVAKAVDPKGDGRYDVEYRVKQLDGSWRWLSAWGVVEFEGEGAAAQAGRHRRRQPRSQRIEAGRRNCSRMLVNELDHRVKNTLAIIQSIVIQTLRGATDLEAARKAVDARIISLAAAHDLLTQTKLVGGRCRRSGGARLGALRRRPGRGRPGRPWTFHPSRLWRLSLALHELATNAAKHGALSQA